MFDSLGNSDAGISILLPGPSSTVEKVTLLGMESPFPNERNLKTEEKQKQKSYDRRVKHQLFSLRLVMCGKCWIVYIFQPSTS